MKEKIKNILIKFLGGYTEKDVEKIEETYEQIIANNEQNNNSEEINVTLINNHIYLALLALECYAKKTLYGKPSDEWIKLMYNVIHNNKTKAMFHYVHPEAKKIYKLNTSLTAEKTIYENCLDEVNNITEIDA